MGEYLLLVEKWLGTSQYGHDNALFLKNLGQDMISAHLFKIQIYILFFKIFLKTRHSYTRRKFQVNNFMLLYTYQVYRSCLTNVDFV